MRKQQNQLDRQSSDLKLWFQILESDKGALGALFDVYAPELLVYGIQICKDPARTKDAIQDLFVNIWQYRHGLAKDVQVRYYLLRCLRRELARSSDAHLKSEHIDVEEFLEPVMSAEATRILDETENHRSSQLQRSLLVLSQREREVISLKYYSNLKLKEIASLLEIKEQTAANTLQNALTKLRKCLTYLLLVCCYF